MAAYRVYLLRNSDGRSYIGLSADPQRRLRQHNAGKSKWTRNGAPWALAWQSEELSLSEARKLENQLKRQKGARGLHHLIERFGS